MVNAIEYTQGEDAARGHGIHAAARSQRTILHSKLMDAGREAGGTRLDAWEHEAIERQTPKCWLDRAPLPGTFHVIVAVWSSAKKQAMDSIGSPSRVGSGLGTLSDGLASPFRSTPGQATELWTVSILQPKPVRGT